MRTSGTTCVNFVGSHEAEYTLPLSVANSSSFADSFAENVITWTLRLLKPWYEKG